MSALDLCAAWDAAISAHVALYGGESTVLMLASQGHPNARAYVAEEIDGLLVCSCGAAAICPGVETPKRNAYREALRKLLACLDAEANRMTIERSANRSRTSTARLVREALGLTMGDAARALNRPVPDISSIETASAETCWTDAELRALALAAHAKKDNA